MKYLGSQFQYHWLGPEWLDPSPGRTIFVIEHIFDGQSQPLGPTWIARSILEIGDRPASAHCGENEGELYMWVCRSGVSALVVRSRPTRPKRERETYWYHDTIVHHTLHVCTVSCTSYWTALDWTGLDGTDERHPSPPLALPPVGRMQPCSLYHTPDLHLPCTRLLELFFPWSPWWLSLSSSDITCLCNGRHPWLRRLVAGGTAPNQRTSHG